MTAVLKMPAARPRPADLSANDELLLAARRLSREAETFGFDELLLAAWADYPESFGLRSCRRRHPDSHRLRWMLSVKSGPIRKGWLRKVAPLTYRLTRAGKLRAAALLGEEPADAGETEPLTLPRSREDLLRRLLGSSAAAKFDSGAKAAVTFGDACAFWDIAQSLKGEAVAEALASVERSLHELESDLAQQDAQLATGRVVSAGDCRVLLRLHEFMADRFERIITLLARR